MKNKKLNSFEALRKIQFDNLAPDPVNYQEPEKKNQKKAALRSPFQQ